MLLQDFSYIVLDVETTGLNPQEGESICEIGALKVKGGKIIDTFVRLVKPRKPIPALISNLTGITNFMVKESPYFGEIAPEFLDFIKDLPIFAYNVKFDINFINSELAAYQREEIGNTLVDILFICRKLFAGKLTRFSLKEVAEFLSIDTSHLHRALADAKVAGEVLQRIIDFLSKRGIKEGEMFLSFFSQANYHPLWQDNHLKILHSAIEEKRCVYIKYFSYSRLDFLDLEILPLKVEKHEGRNYLIGKYLDKEGDSIFSVSRIVKLNRA